MFSYLVYGLNIRTAMPLPELVSGDEAGKEVRIRFGRVDYPPLEDAEGDWAHCSTAPKEDYLFWKGVGSFWVRGGRDIVLDPYPTVNEKMLRLFVLGPLLGILLRQRGHLLLHASAVAVAGEAVLFLGGSGWGKSTTAAALHARGYGLVTDDMAVLRVNGSRPVVLPSFPQLKLWPEAALSLGDDPEKLPRWNPHVEKRARSAGHEFSSTPLPVKRIYLLDEGDNTPRVLPFRPQKAFVELTRHTYGSDYGLQTAMGIGSDSHFRKCTSIINKVSVCGLKRQKSLGRLLELVRLVEEDLAQSVERNVLSAG
jgi:hypothetical protein